MSFGLCQVHLSKGPLAAYYGVFAPCSREPLEAHPYGKPLLSSAIQDLHMAYLGPGRACTGAIAIISASNRIHLRNCNGELE